MLTSPKLPTITKKLTLFSIYFLIASALSLVLIQAKPFGVDEWRLIYNLKFKNPSALWYELDFMQEFPRMYLQFIKAFSAPFDYSYFTLRFPSFCVGILSIVLCYRLMNKLYKTRGVLKYLFIIILVASHAFIQHFIEIKQYTMDILLSLVAIWQLVQVLSIQTLSKQRYILLCGVFFIAPFFSYTYPITIAPVYCIAYIQSIVAIYKQKTFLKQYLLKLWLPLVIGFTSIICFYIIDVSRVMDDNGMELYWADHMLQHGFNATTAFTNIFMLFGQIGSGILFQALFGICGLASFILATIRCLKKYPTTILSWLRLYSTMLIATVLLLFFIGKLPLGVARLNAFTIPAIAILIVDFISAIRIHFRKPRLTMALPAILYLGLVGNIYNSFINSFIKDGYFHKLMIYEHTEDAIIEAQARHLPILITAGIAFPDEKMLHFPAGNMLGKLLCLPPDYEKTIHCVAEDDMPGDWVLKTFPAYKPAIGLPVYAVANAANLNDCIGSLPASIKTFIIGDGTSYKLVNR